MAASADGSVATPAAASTTTPATTDRNVRITVASPFTCERDEARPRACLAPECRLSGWTTACARPVTFVGASTGVFGPVWAQAELRNVLAAIGALVLDAELAVPAAYTAFAPDGRLPDAALAAALNGTRPRAARTD